MPKEYVTAYGGEYSAACKDKSALRARISSEGMSLIRGSKTIITEFDHDALSYFGRNIPDGFQGALMGKKGIAFIMYESKKGSGSALEVDADPAVLKQLGIGKSGPGRLTKC
jgi:hypothetical protein